MCECTHGSGKHIFIVVRLGSPMFYSIGLPFSIFDKTTNRKAGIDYGYEKSSNYYGKRQ